MKRPYQVGWWDDPFVDFDLRTPWWINTQRTAKLGDKLVHGQYSISAAVMAYNPDDAMAQIVDAYADEVQLKWQFVHEHPYGWMPFGNKRPLQPRLIWDQRPH